MRYLGITQSEIDSLLYLEAAKNIGLGVLKKDYWQESEKAWFDIGVR